VVAALAGVAETVPCLAESYTFQMKESMSITSRSPRGPAPADQARRIDSANTRPSWRTWPESERAQEDAQRRGRHPRCPTRASPPPARSTSQIVDRIGSKRHPVHERADLTAGLRRGASRGRPSGRRAAPGPAG
jgi:hypothetical protein